MWVSPRLEMSKHSIRIGIASMPSSLAQLLERVDPLRAPVLVAQPVLVERQPRVALGQLEDPALVAALGVADLDVRAAPLAQRLLQHVDRRSAPRGTITCGGIAGEVA